MVDERRRRFGEYLARLRHRAHKSQRQLAELLCAISGTSSVTRNEISRWERGVRVPDVWLPALSAALGVPVTDLECAAAYARGETVPDGSPSPIETLSVFLPDDSEHLGPLASNAGRRVGISTAIDLASRAHGLRLADDVIAGGDLVAPAFRELGAAVRLYRCWRPRLLHMVRHCFVFMGRLVLLSMADRCAGERGRAGWQWAADCVLAV